MVPFLDLLNHVHGETVMWELASDEKKHVLFSNKDKEHKEGDEVFNNYGYKTVEELFLSHGFCGTGTGHKDVVALRVGSPAVSKEVDEAKVAILRDMEVPVAVRPNGNLSVGPLYLVTGSAEEPILNQELLLSMAVCGMAHIPTDEEPIEIGIDELDVLKAQLGHKLEILGDLSWILETLNSNVKGESTPHTHHTRKVQAALYVKGQVDLLNEALGEIVKFLPVPDGEESEEEEEHEEGV
ncbi:hypothetical protein SARC_03192 [Sphaeroforma arctica JP610]|uniref:SET domain-containing protein n=1 Tax=Sphaeroforma arctica JP610 TaxID=667725 RepID=A0A0L0G6G0_9EUKA|nr:hypothetical protein SARC_03192 [Sphaeroforma arctica JP610]KNC84595.1 hypothetical protein SARC_03192 [Sphaeroforma arctica JP610]|eukprot:XP_014158497.1 hypothetical protein SARC_03192 [Sphaeroforma arctica JP610]